MICNGKDSSLCLGFPYLWFPCSLRFFCTSFPALVERFDAVKFGIFQRNLSNFRGLVLFCIEADVCSQILIFLAFCEIYKICTPSHRSKLKIFAKNRQTVFAFLYKFLQKSFFSTIFIEFCTDFDDFFRNFAEHSRKC